MYIMINDIMGKKRIDLTNSSKEFAVVSMFSNNIQYEFMKSNMLELEESRIKQIMAGTYTRQELISMRKDRNDPG